MEQITSISTKKEKKRWANQNPYLYQLQQQRRAANKKRQDEIAESRKKAMGNPVHGITTPFVESFDSGGQNIFSTPPTNEDGNPLEEPHRLPISKHIKNYGIEKTLLDRALFAAEQLARPVQATSGVKEEEDLGDKMQEDHRKLHAKREEAVKRILALETGNARNRLSANIRRIVETLGRHKTDFHLEKNPVSLTAPPRELTPRAGPDTGSSEVQIAILTAKIRALSQALEKTGHGDKHGKRDLRIMVHKRQKLLKYMFRKEKGGPRWSNMVKKLGITDACWKWEITM